MVTMASMFTLINHNSGKHGNVIQSSHVTKCLAVLFLHVYVVWLLTVVFFSL